MSGLRDVGNGEYFKSLVVAGPKDGKTCFLIASCLGALPHQTRGLVTSPAHLHVFAADTGAVEGVGQFLTGKTTCNRPDEMLDIDVINLGPDIAKVMSGDSDWDFSLFNSVRTKAADLRKRMAAQPGVHAVIMSSLTGLCEAVQRGLAGPPSSAKKGGGMDQSKWQDERRQLVEIRTMLQGGNNHCFWEGHVFTVGEGEAKKESVGIPGQAGKQWGVNVAQVYRLRRELNVKYPNSVVEKQLIDTQPKLEFTAAGRGSTLLEPKETDLVVMADKLGLKVGGYVPGAK